MSVQYDKGILKHLKDGVLSHDRAHQMQSRYKDSDRFRKMLEIWRESVDWDDKILMPLAEHLFVVIKPDGRRVIKSTWGYEYCEAHENWKLFAKVFVRDSPELMREVYPEMLGAHTDWMQIREYYDPLSGALLEVEAVPPGYPIVHDFKPDIDTFSNEWLKMPVPEP